MVSAAKFIRGLEGNMRLRVNNKPIPDYARGFKNPVPKPPNGGNGYIIPVVKFIAKGFKYAPLMLLYDLVFPKPVSDGTLPAWVKDVGQQEPVGEPILNATGVAGKQYDLRYRTYAGGTLVPKEGITSLGTNVYAPYQLKFTFTANITGSDTEGFPKLSAKAPVGSQGGDFFLEVIGRTQSGLGQATFKTNRLGTTSFGLQGYIEFLGLVGGANAPVPPPSQDLSPPTRDPKQVLIDQINAEDWKFSGFTELPTIKPGKITKIPDFFKLPEITKKPAVIPTEIPQPIPDPDEIPDLDIFPDPEPVFVPTPRPKIIPEPIINPDPQPDINPTPDKTPKPEKKWTKIIRYQPDPQPKSGSFPPAIINYPPPVKTTDKTENDDPKPSGNGIIIPPPPPIQTGVDDCAGSCSTKALAKGSPGLLNIAGLLNDAAIQNPLLKKIDETTTITKNTITSPEFGLKKIQGFADTAWKATHADKILNGLNTMLLIHNGLMLSNNIGQTIGYVANNALATVGIKNSDGSAINVNSVIKSKLTNVLENALGSSNYASLTTKLAAANRVYQTGANILSNVRSIIDSTQDIAETTGENVAVIGNALRHAGTVRDNAYSYMPESLDNTSRVINKLQKASDAASALEDITSEAVDLKDEIKEMQDSQKEFNDAKEKLTTELSKQETVALNSITKAPEQSELDEERAKPKE